MAEEIIKVIDALCEKFGIAVDWTAENIMPYIQELFSKVVLWKMWNAIVAIIICTILIVGASFAICKICKIVKDFKYGWDDDFWHPWVTALFIAVIAISSIVLICNGYSLIKTLIFPDLVMLEYVQKLLSSK